MFSRTCIFISILSISALVAVSALPQSVVVAGGAVSSLLGGVSVIITDVVINLVSGVGEILETVIAWLNGSAGFDKIIFTMVKPVIRLVTDLIKMLGALPGVLVKFVAGVLSSVGSVDKILGDNGLVPGLLGGGSSGGGNSQGTTSVGRIPGGGSLVGGLLGGSKRSGLLGR